MARRTISGKPRRSTASPAIHEHRLAVQQAKASLADFDYIGILDRFRHRKSGDLMTERSLLNLMGYSIPPGMDIQSALYTSALGVRQYAGITFVPGASPDVVQNGQVKLNAWSRSEIVLIEGDPQLFLDLVQLIFDHNTEASKFFLDAIAWLLQRPAEKWAFMLLIIGKQGVGKSLLCEMVAEMVGRKNAAFPSVDSMKSSFSGWLLNSHVVIFHELERMTREVTTKLKHLVTTPDLMINAKNLPEFYIKNYVNILACSNHDDIAALDADDRRMFTWISQAEKQAPEYYGRLCEWFFEGDGKGIVFTFLMNRDLSGFNPNAAPPKTLGRDRLIANSRSEAENFLRDALDSGRPPFASDLCIATEVLQYPRCAPNSVLRCRNSAFPKPIRHIDWSSSNSRRAPIHMGHSQSRALENRSARRTRCCVRPRL